MTSGNSYGSPAPVRQTAPHADGGDEQHQWKPRHPEEEAAAGDWQS